MDRGPRFRQHCTVLHRPHRYCVRQPPKCSGEARRYARGIRSGGIAVDRRVEKNHGGDVMGYILSACISPVDGKSFVQI